MTVTYSLNVANAKLTGFSKLLLRWKGSIYKLLYREMLIFFGLYYSLNISYRYFLTKDQKIVFEKSVKYCRAFTNSIPLVFVLSFYVSIVVTRWWQQFMQIPWPDKAVLLISGYVRGDDERGRIIRRTLARYLILMQVLTFQAVSTSVRRRFPTLDHIQEVGLFTSEERQAYDEIIDTHGKWWVPAQWFTSLVIRARKAGRIKHDYLMDKIIEELHAYRSCCGMMFAYDWISIPLVYTQTVTIATYTYFIATIMGKQYLDGTDIDDSKLDIEYYVPVFTFLEFFFFMGWLKVAEQLINPYGEDDDDFELNWCLDRNLLISYIIVDEMYDKHPKLVPDSYWDKREPTLPYTKSSISMKSNSQPHMGSTVNLDIEPEDYLPMETIMEEDREDYNYSSPLTTSITDFANTPNWFNNYPNQVPHSINSTIVNMNNANNVNQSYPNTFNNVSRNHSELIDSLKGESNSRSSNRNGLRFLRDLCESKFFNMILEHTHIQKKKSFHNVNKNNNLSSFILKTPTKKIRTTSSMVDSINESNKLKSMQTSSNVTPNTLIYNNTNSMNNSINGSGNNLNNALSNMGNNLSSFSLSNNNLSYDNMSNNNLVNSSIPSTTNKKRSNSKLVPKISLPETGWMYNDFKSSKSSKLSKLNQCSPLNYKYSNLHTAPVLPSSAFKTRKMTSLLNAFRNGMHFSSDNHRNLTRFGKRNKQNSFSSSISLKSKCNEDNLISSNGFHFPKNYVPPENPNQYFLSYFNQLNISQENNINKKNSNKSNLNSCLDNNIFEITVSPNSTSTSSKKNLTENQSLGDLNEENLINVQDKNKFDKQDEIKLNSNAKNLSIAKAAEILEAFNENDLNNQTKLVDNETNILEKNDVVNSTTSSQSLLKEVTLLSSNSESSIKSKETVKSKIKEDNNENKEDCEESVVSSSLSSLSPYESNQSTITSYTQLIEKKS